MGGRFFDYCDPNVVAQIRTALAEQPIGKVLDAVSMPSSLEPISQLVGVGSKIAAVLPVNTPMPNGVEIKPVMFGRCNDVSGPELVLAAADPAIVYRKRRPCVWIWKGQDVALVESLAAHRGMGLSSDGTP